MGKSPVKKQNVTPGAMLTGEASSWVTGEASRPRELLERIWAMADKRFDKMRDPEVVVLLSEAAEEIARLRAALFSADTFIAQTKPEGHRRIRDRLSVALVEESL